MSPITHMKLIRQMQETVWYSSRVCDRYLKINLCSNKGPITSNLWAKEATRGTRQYLLIESRGAKIQTRDLSFKLDTIPSELPCFSCYSFSYFSAKFNFIWITKHRFKKRSFVNDVTQIWDFSKVLRYNQLPS